MLDAIDVIRNEGTDTLNDSVDQMMRNGAVWVRDEVNHRKVWALFLDGHVKVIVWVDDADFEVADDVDY